MGCRCIKNATLQHFSPFSWWRSELGSEFVNRDVAAVKAHILIDIKTRPRHAESNRIVERFNGTVRQESGDHYVGNYLSATRTAD